MGSADLELDNLAIHLARYMFVARQLRGSERLVEVGCGWGYGSALLSGYADSVAAYDKIIPSDELAKRYPQVEFVAELPDAADFDVVVSLEVLEHMPLEEGRAFLEHLHRLGGEEAVTFVSTPRRLPDDQRSENRRREHPHEYTAEELRGELEAVFRHVHLFSQNDLFIGAQSPHMAWNYVAICTK